MQELQWNTPAAPIDAAPTAAQHGGRAARAFWEDGLTLALTAAAFICVIVNAENANWVEGLPSLYPIGIGALVAAYAMSRVRLHQFLLLPAGLLLGATLTYFQIMAILQGGSLVIKTDHLLDRMYVWWSALTGRGTSIDPLPIIVIMLVATWLGSYLAAWAIFRWRNAVIGLTPGLAALTWNLGFSDTQFSLTAVLYVIIGVLLVMRLRVSREQTRWERDDVPYPKFIAFSVLNVTFWATCAILAAVWLFPSGPQSASASDRWSTITGPLTDRLAPIAGAFISINPDKGLKIHAFKDALILQGGIDPGLIAAAQITGELPPDVAPFLRDQSFSQYRRDGWRVNAQDDLPLPAGQSVAPIDSAPGIDPLTRKPLAITVKVQGGNGDRLLSVGQPTRSDEPAQSITGSAAADVSGLSPEGHLSNGTSYTVIGSVSAATVDQLRAAGTAYPDWVTNTYLQLSRRLSSRVGEQANELATGAANPYDAAVAIEDYLRTFPIDYGVPGAPDGQDPVDYFLFDAQRGYFDYHASAMTIMLRTLGIPARLASGFVIDPARQQGDTDTFKLTQQQAFAWPEVYFPSIGWVEFNPTPSEPLVPRPALPQTSIPDEPPLTVAPESGRFGGVSIRSLPDITDAVSFVGWRLFLVALSIAAAIGIGIAILAALFTWELRLRGLGLSAKLWEKSLVLASLGSTGPQAHETPRAYADRIAGAIPAAADIVYIAASYERAKFGNKPPSRDEVPRLRGAWSSTRTALLRRALRLRNRGLPAHDSSPT